MLAFHGNEMMLFFAATFVTGVGTLATITWRGELRFSEPATSIAAFLCYLPVTYAITFLTVITGTSPLVTFIVALVYLIGIHATWKLALLWFRKHHPRTLLSLRHVPSHRLAGAIGTSRNATEYRQMIVAIELGAKRLDRVPKRLSVVFKTPEAVRDIASQRFGSGSDSMRDYIEEHDERSREFFAALQRGAEYREVYSKAELIEYATTRKHGKRAVLSAYQVQAGLQRWLDCARKYSNYKVGLTDEKLPFKYEIVDRRVLVLHEALGENDRGRVNALVIEDERTVLDFQEDFNSIWERIEPQQLSIDETEEWVLNVLFPILDHEKETNNATPREVQPRRAAGQRIP